MAEEDGHAVRRPWRGGPDGDAAGWLALSDDEVLFRISELPAAHDDDQLLMVLVQSDRHFFVRQEAAKKIRDKTLLKEHLHDRHIGQILVRGMTRREDLAYLEKLLEESRHVEVRKAAEAQLRILRKLTSD